MIKMNKKWVIKIGRTVQQETEITIESDSEQEAIEAGMGLLTTDFIDEEDWSEPEVVDSYIIDYEPCD